MADLRTTSPEVCVLSCCSLHSCYFTRHSPSAFCQKAQFNLFWCMKPECSPKKNVWTRPPRPLTDILCSRLTQEKGRKCIFYCCLYGVWKAKEKYMLGQIALDNSATLTKNQHLELGTISPWNRTRIGIYHKGSALNSLPRDFSLARIPIKGRRFENNGPARGWPASSRAGFKTI